MEAQLAKWPIGHNYQNLWLNMYQLGPVRKVENTLVLQTWGTVMQGIGNIDVRRLKERKGRHWVIKERVTTGGSCHTKNWETKGKTLS